MIQFPEFPASNNCCAYSAEGNTQPAHRFVRQRDLADTGERGRGGAHGFSYGSRKVGPAAPTPFPPQTTRDSTQSVVPLNVSWRVTRSTASSQ